MHNNNFEVQFAEIANIINEPLNSYSEKHLKTILIKLNNPNFYTKFTRTHPMSEFGYYKHKTINPILISIRSMLSILKEKTSLDIKMKKLQEEFSWAFHEYQKCSGWFKINSAYTIN